MKGQTHRQLSYFMPVYGTFNRKTEEKPKQHVFNFAEYAYFHVFTDNPPQKPSNINAEQKKQNVTVNNGDDGDMKCLFSPGKKS